MGSRRHDKQAQFYAFDMLAGDGEDYRPQALSLRKANLSRLLKRRVDGIFIAEYEHGDIGQDLFQAACRMHLEGIVSKCLESRLCGRSMQTLAQDKESCASGVQQGQRRSHL
jgi:bifunctional non-homologous end joining protein LigD